MSIEEEEDLSHRVTKAAWILSKERANIQISKEKVQSYKEAFEQIRKYNGISDIDELVKEFIASEEHNFSLFNYVNSQTHELEKLEEEIENLKREQLAYGSEGGPGNDNSQHKQLQKDLRQSFEFINASIEQYDAKHQQVDNTISALKVAIQHIFNKIDCDVSNMSDMLADSQVTEANMMQYLGIIEQRTNEVLQLWALKDEAPNTAVSKDAEPARIASSIANAIGQGPSHPMGEQKVQITPPTMDEFAFDDEANSDDDDIQMPQTIDTIIAQIKSQMGKHNNHANGRRGYRRK